MTQMFYIDLKGKLSQRKLRQRYSSQRERERERDREHRVSISALALSLGFGFPLSILPFPFDWLPYFMCGSIPRTVRLVMSGHFLKLPRPADWTERNWPIESARNRNRITLSSTVTGPCPRPPPTYYYTTHLARS